MRVRVTCLCGSAHGELPFPDTPPPLKAVYCHCNSCRHMTGCMCLTSIPFLSGGDDRPTKDLVPRLKAFEFSKDRIRHYFCPNCGTHMLAHVLPRQQDKSEGKWFIMCGILEKADNVYLPSHEYIADTIDGGFSDLIQEVNGDTIERWAGYPREKEQLPPGWVLPGKIDIQLSPENRLYAHCKCGGIECWISHLNDGTKYLAKIWACSSCRLGSGMEWFVGAWATIPLSKIHVDRQGRRSLPPSLEFGTMKTYESSAGVTRTFCGTCGASFFMYQSGEEVVRVAVGILDAAEGARAENWLKWNFQDVSYREDATSRNEVLMIAFEEGIKRVL